MGLRGGPRKRRWVLLAIGLLVSAAAVASAFVRPVIDDGALRLIPRFDLRAWLAALPSHARWLLPFLALQAFLPVLRARVWFFTAPAPPPSRRILFHALALGGLVHNILPGRIGVVAIPWFGARLAGEPGAKKMVELLSSLLVARLLEFFALVTLLAVTAPLAAARMASASGFGRSALLGVAVALLLATILVGLARLAPALAGWLEARGRLLTVARFAAALAAGLRGAGSVRRLALGLGFAFAPAAAAGLGYGLALQALGVQAGIWAGFILLGAVTVGQITPGLPIGGGVYVLTCSLTARALGASESDAAALAVLSNAAAALAHILVGTASAARNPGALGALRGARRAATEG